MYRYRPPKRRIRDILPPVSIRQSASLDHSCCSCQFHWISKTSWFSRTSNSQKRSSKWRKCSRSTDLFKISRLWCLRKSQKTSRARFRPRRIVWISCKDSYSRSGFRMHQASFLRRRNSHPATVPRCLLDNTAVHLAAHPFSFRLRSSWRIFRPFKSSNGADRQRNLLRNLCPHHHRTAHLRTRRGLVSRSG